MPQIKYKYGPGYPVQHHAEMMAIEIGDSLSKFIEVVHREFTALKLRGIHFNSINISFGTSDAMICPEHVTITIQCDLAGKLQTQYGEVEEDSRTFHAAGKTWIEDAFWLIYYWHQELIEYHQKALAPPKQSSLFTPKQP